MKAGDPPSQRVLDKYGLSAAAWLALSAKQGGACAVCKNVPKTKEVKDKKTGLLVLKTPRLCVDHEHVTGFKELPPEKRAACVRGLLCFWCNKSYVGRAITTERALAVVEHLRSYEERKAL